MKNSLNSPHTKKEYLHIARVVLVILARAVRVPVLLVILVEQYVILPNSLIQDVLLFLVLPQDTQAMLVLALAQRGIMEQ